MAKDPKALFNAVEARAKERLSAAEKRLTNQLDKLTKAPGPTGNPNGEEPVPSTPGEARAALFDQIERLVSLWNGQRISQPGPIQLDFKVAAAQVKNKLPALLKATQMTQGQREAIQGRIALLEQTVLRGRGEGADIIIDQLKDMLGIELFARAPADTDPEAIRLLLKARKLVEEPLARINRVRAGVQMAKEIIIQEGEVEERFELIETLNQFDRDLQLAKKNEDLETAQRIVNDINDTALSIKAIAKGETDSLLQAVIETAKDVGRFITFTFSEDETALQVSGALFTAARVFDERDLYTLIERLLFDAAQKVSEGEALNAILIALQNVRENGLISLLTLRSFVAIVGNVAVPLRSATRGDLIVPREVADAVTISGIIPVVQQLGILKTPTFLIDATGNIVLAPRKHKQLTEEQVAEVQVRLNSITRAAISIRERAPEDLILFLKVYLSALGQEIEALPILRLQLKGKPIIDRLNNDILTPLVTDEERGDSVNILSVLAALGFPPDAIEAVLPKIQVVKATPSASEPGKALISVRFRENLTDEEIQTFSGASIASDKRTEVNLLSANVGDTLGVPVDLAPDDSLTAAEYLEKFMTPDQLNDFLAFEDELTRIVIEQAEIINIFDKTGVPHVDQLVRLMFGQMNEAMISAAEWTSLSKKTTVQLIESGLSPSLPTMVVGEQLIFFDSISKFIADFAEKINTEEGLLIAREWGLLAELPINNSLPVTFYERFSRAEAFVRMPAVRIGADVLIWLKPLTLIRSTAKIAQFSAPLTRPTIRLLSNGTRQLTSAIQKAFRFTGRVFKRRREIKELRNISAQFKAFVEGRQVPAEVVYIGLRQEAAAVSPTALAQFTTQALMWSDVIGTSRFRSLLVEKFINLLFKVRGKGILWTGRILRFGTPIVVLAGTEIALDFGAFTEGVAGVPQQAQEPTVTAGPAELLVRLVDEFLEQNPTLAQALNLLACEVERENEIIAAVAAEQAKRLQDEATTGVRGESQVSTSGSTIPEVIIPGPLPLQSLEPIPVPPEVPEVTPPVTP